jgi:hypothetical protein
MSHPSRPLDDGSAYVAMPAAALRGALVSAILALTLLAVLWDRPINHDTAWYLVATRDWLNGAALYVDIVEVNPPLTFYLTIPAVLLAEALPIGLANAQYVALCLLFWLSLTWTWRIAGAGGMSSERQAALYLVAALAMVVPFLSAVAQREHLMVLLVMPWIVGKLTGGSEAPRETGRALLAAVGVCIKPFFVLYPIAVTLYEIWLTRSLRPVLGRSNLVFLAVGLGYVGMVALRHPLYLTDIIPIARHVYGDYGLDGAFVLQPLRHPAIILGLTALLVAVRTSVGTSGGYFVVLTGAAMAIYLIQWTGYSYQFFPVVAMLLLAAGWLMIHAGPLSPGGVLAIAAAFSLVSPMVRMGFHWVPATEALAEEIRLAGGSDRLGVISTSLPPGPPVALATGAEWTSRYPALWLVPGALNGLASTDCSAEPDTCTTLLRIRDRTLDEIVTDLVTSRPDTLIFDGMNDYIQIPGFRWEAFLSEDPRFAAFMEGYGPAKVLGEFRIFRLDDPTRVAQGRP